MKYLTALLPLLAVALGTATIIAGGADDSPGLQLIGVAIIAAAITLTVRTLSRSPRQ